MPVRYGFALRSYGGDTIHAGRATVMPWNKPALFRSPVRPGESRMFKEIAGSTRCIPIQCGACRRRYGVIPVGHGVSRRRAGTEHRDNVNEA